MKKTKQIPEYRSPSHEVKYFMSVSRYKFRVNGLHLFYGCSKSVIINNVTDTDRMVAYVMCRFSDADFKTWHYHVKHGFKIPSQLDPFYSEVVRVVQKEFARVCKNSLESKVSDLKTGVSSLLNNIPAEEVLDIINNVIVEKTMTE